MSQLPVLIIGCGIAGPILALLLKAKGYHAIVFEKVRQLGDAGASLMLMPNGMKVLDLVGLANDIYASSIPLEAYEDFTAAGEPLGSSGLPARFLAKYGQRAVGVKRTWLNLTLKNRMTSAGIELREGWELVSIEEDTHAVTASFTNGQKVQGLFIVGCDGIKAASRLSLLKQMSVEQPSPTFTGLTQTSGISPAPSTPARPSLRNWFGEGVHFISYPVSRDRISWAVTLPQTRVSPESWRLYKDQDMQELQDELSKVLQGFEPSIVELVQSAERLLKFGLFDRRTLDADEWYSERVVLAGDAAHPTSPHLGQGANQALEDCYHLSQALPDCTGMNAATTNIDLPSVFKQYALKRQPRTAALVKGARAAGEKRVVTTGLKDCESRNHKVKEEWLDTVAIEAKFDGLCREPFNTVA
ncbi:hypothetical protein PFICI_13759 [Pestalotiopsis fici W106-1]|uniref:FAD-binding domain-containing protein n=1 Tax=Pestalotiopsis fici (strain W106-1 / CGMCC3.15140) TaxID=1229662 RepID=W3WJ36_PESFW|nr:uncharacterized protein PFICI_13759 [Pestalotiopsis fici W106-1]ETS73893.1 hypothetical protein PFICI_13759 [Pestalotiopsis fici W106-1]